MKTLPDGMQDHLDSGVTTLCWCWKLMRDGTAQGFTDHDEDVTFDGVTYAAASGISAGELRSMCDYSVDDLSVAGALSSDTLNENDLAAGIYDGAAVEIWRVNWADPVMRVLMRKGTLGEVKRGRNAFEAEIRGLMQVLNQPVGHAYAYTCDADVGDDRCTVDTSAAAFHGSGTVTGVTDNRRFVVSGLDDFSSAWFSGGKLSWSGGVNQGLAIEIKRHGKTATSTVLEIWQTAANDVAIGDTFTVTVGCDKRFSTCKQKFSNAANFRGFPYMPGNNAVIGYANANTDMDGGSRYGN